MFAKFRSWYTYNYQQITWFIIGFLMYDGLVNLIRENYAGAIISLGLAAVNWYFGLKDRAK